METPYIGFMKPIVCLLFIGLFSFSTRAQEIDDAQVAFVNRFKEAVMDHNYKKVFKFLDKDYRKEQLKFLEGNKEQLVNELFSGQSGEKYVTLKVTEILKIEIAEIEKIAEGYVYIFRVRDTNSDILSDLLLVKKGKKFGFVGASG